MTESATEPNGLHKLLLEDARFTTEQFTDGLVFYRNLYEDPSFWWLLAKAVAEDGRWVRSEHASHIGQLCLQSAHISSAELAFSLAAARGWIQGDDKELERRIHRCLSTGNRSELGTYLLVPNISPALVNTVEKGF